MSRAWDKEKIWVPDGIWTYDYPNSGREALYPLELRRTYGERGHLLGSYLTRVMHTARISKVDVVLCGDNARIHALVPFATSSILALKDNFCHLTFVEARNLSNHALASSKRLFANLQILDVFSIYSLQVSSFMYLYHNDALPISFTQIFQTGNQTHQYSTRYSDFYWPQTCRTNIKKNSIRSQGARIWNSLPNNIIYSSVWSNHLKGSFLTYLLSFLFHL